MPRPRDTFVPKGRSPLDHGARAHTARATYDDRPTARYASKVDRGGDTLHHRVPSEQLRHASPPRLADKVARIHTRDARQGMVPGHPGLQDTVRIAAIPAA